MGEEPRWRLDLNDDATITFDESTKTITGEAGDLGRYPALEIDGRTLHVSGGHAPPLGKWYVTQRVPPFTLTAGTA
jgi:hypothetical protein